MQLDAKDVEFAAYAAFRNRLLAAAAGGFALSFSALQVEVIRETPGLTTTWFPLMVALALGLLSALVEMVDNRVVTHWRHKMAVEPPIWVVRRFSGIRAVLHAVQVASLALMTVAVVVSFIVLTNFGADVARAAREAASAVSMETRA